MLHIDFNPFPIITTARLVLRQLRAEDANEIFQLRSDEKAAAIIPRHPSKKIEEATEFINKVNSNVRNNESVYWGIVPKSNSGNVGEKVIGTICLWNISKENHRGEVGFELLPSFQGKGLMNEALVAVIDYAFNTLKLHSLEGNVNPLNVASIKLMEKNKFIREAYFRENIMFDGVFRDTAVYTLIT